MNTIIKIKNVESDVNNKLVSKINTGMNRVVKNIKAVGVNEDGLVVIVFKSDKTLYINYIKSTYAFTLKALKTAKPRYNYNVGNQTRMSITLGLTTGRTRIQLGTLICIANELYNGIVRNNYIGLDCNHKDCTGNYNRYKYINNRIENLELVDKGDNKRHEVIIKLVEKTCHKHICISAVDPIINYINILDKEELIEFFNNKGKKYVIQ